MTTTITGSGAGSWCDDGSTSAARAPWTVMILPMLEQDNLYSQFRFETAFPTDSHMDATADPINVAASQQSLAAFQCPSNPGGGSGSLNNDYYGVMGGGSTPTGPNHCSTMSGLRVFYSNGMLYLGSATRFGDIVDGTTNVLMVGETRYHQTPTGRADGFHRRWASGTKTDSWGLPGNLAAAQEAINSYSGNGARNDTYNWMSRIFGSHHTGGAHFLMADASVHFLSESMDLAIYRSLGARNDGLPVGGFSP